MKLVNDIVDLYKDEPVNIALKSKNFIILILVLSIVSIVLFPVCLINGQAKVLPIIVAILLFCIISYYLLKKKKYFISTSIFFVLLGFLPFLLALSQESQVYRDVYLYYFFCPPFFLLSAIAGYKKKQVLFVGGLQLICAVIYVFTRVLQIPNIVASNEFFCLVIGTVFHIMIASFLIINLNLEAKIIATLKVGQNKVEKQLVQLQDLVNQSQVILDAVQNVSLTLEQYVSSVSGTMETVNQINGSINRIASEAKNHSMSISKLSEAMNSTKVLLHKNISSMENLKQSIKAMVNVISVIESITEQTNLLAINASIDASHAGDFGKGFAVVANEIKNLAEKTAINSKKVKEVLDVTNKDLANVDEDIKNTVQEFDNISEVSTNVNHAFDLIIDGSFRVTSDASQISNIISDLVEMLKSINNQMNEIAKNINNSAVENI